jgi:hypothetical protein
MIDAEAGTAYPATDINLRYKPDPISINLVSHSPAP